MEARIIYRIGFVEKVGYDPTPLDFQSSASTKLASSPFNSSDEYFISIRTTVIKCITFIHRPSHGFTAYDKLFLGVDSNYQPPRYQRGTLTIELPKNMWSKWNSNPQPQECKSCAHPLELLPHKKNLEILSRGFLIF